MNPSLSSNSLSRSLAALFLVATAGLAEPSEIKLTNVYDAFGTPVDGLTHDFGFSMVVDYGGQTILFDSGTDAELFAQNLDALGIDPKEIDIAVASHNHHDHISGFDHLLEVNPDVKLYLPNDFTLGAPLEMSVAGRDPAAADRLPAEMTYFGGERDVARVESTGRFRGADVEWVGETTSIGEGITLVATRSDLMGHFVRYPPFGDDPRHVPMPELSLSLRTREGEVLLVGCSHSSVEVIVERAREEVGNEIELLVGGYHLLPYDRDEIATIASRLRDNHGVHRVAPAHCSGHLAFEQFRKAYEARYEVFGLGAVIEF